MDDIELTPEEIEKVNTIILGIQSELNRAIEEIEKNNYDSALEYIKNGISKSNCPVCKRELGILIADIVHAKTICPLNPDLCIAEKEAVIDNATELKNDFVPLTAKKKALKEKAKDLGKNIPKKEEIFARKKIRLDRLLPLPFPFIRIK